MTTYLPGLLERLSAPIVSSKLDKDDFEYLGKYESEISDPDNSPKIKPEYSLTNFNGPDSKYQQYTYLSSLNSHIVDQDAQNFFYPVKYTDKIVRNNSSFTYLRTTSSFTDPLVDYIEKNHENSDNNSFDLNTNNPYSEHCASNSDDTIDNNSFDKSSNNCHKLSTEASNSHCVKRPEEDTELVFTPGFTRQLGTKGRRVLLDLIRKIYRSNPEHFKNILALKNPPTSISNLPFFNVTMLWELANDFGIFDQALKIHYTYGKPCHSLSRNTNSANNKIRKISNNRSKKIKHNNLDYESYDEDEYISSFSNSRTSKGRRIVQPKRFNDYDQTLDNNYRFYANEVSNQHNQFVYNSYYIPDQSYYDENSSFYYKNKSYDYMNLDKLKGHKIKRFASPLIC